MPVRGATDLPTGTVTFLFTDIQGSTKLVRSLGIERWRGILQTHYDLLRDAFAANNGHEVNTEGDAFFIAFASAPDAVAACAAGQRALAAHDWPQDAVIRVRMGLHSGVAAMVGGDYMGFEIHRAARIASTGHGGQVVMSDATRALVKDALPDGVSLLDMGSHRLKDLAGPERIWQLRIDGLPAEFPPLKSLDFTPNNLPTQLTSFVGRETELAEAARLLHGSRLLTLTGPGGTGKTRLSLQVAADAAEGFKDGVYFVALASVIDPELVSSAIVDALKVQDAGTRKPLDVIIDQLRDRELLLLLDNFEQILEAAPTVAEILKAAPGVKVIATSRAPLRVYGEQEFPIAPLSLPEPSAAGTVESLAQFAAVQLFIERAVSVRPGFQVTSENATTVAAICALVDGLPLAIELAAARIRIFSPEVMLARLQTSLADLSGGARDLPARQQTIRGTIEWSCELLDPGPRTLMDRLAVFAGGARLEQIEQVCAPGLDADVLSGLDTLVEQNLLRADDRGPGPRFLMLHVIREFAHDRLRESPDYDAVRLRHADAYLELAETAGPELTGRQPLPWLDQLDVEHDNIRGALGFFRETDRASLALRMVAALWRFWAMRGHIIEARDAIRHVLEMPGSEAHKPERLLAWEAAGDIAWWSGDVLAASAAYAQSLAEARELGDDAAIARNLFNSVFPAGAGKDLETPLALAEDALARFEALGDTLAAARVRWIKSPLLRRMGQVQESYDLASTAIEVFRSADSRFDLVWGLHAQGLAALHLERLDEAGRIFAESLSLIRESGDMAGTTVLLGDFSDLAARRADAERSVKLRGASAALQKATGSSVEEALKSSYNPREGVFSLDEAEYRAFFESGAAMSREEAIVYALEGGG